MRKLVLFMHISLDGHVAAKDKDRSWDGDSSEIFEKIVPELISKADTLLLGRVVANDLLGYWLSAEANDPHLSKGEIAYARWATGAKKVVLSNVEEKPIWPNTEIRAVKDDEDMVKVVNDLKQQSGQDIIVHGGVRTARNLAKLDLIDEYQLVMHPALLGSGLPIFDELKHMSRLDLKSVEKLQSGVLFLDYVPVSDKKL
jgi:dihydrofolate reductase